jgi:16S rRNA (uracil1498-N3)-methyltransferase
MELAELAELAGTPPCLAQPGGGRPTLADTVVAIGPEGGWDDDERSRWGEGMGLGPTVLRSETAAVAAGTVLCALRGGLVGPLA